MTTEMTIINEYPLVNKEYQKKMWVTFKDIDKVHGRPTGTAKRNFNNNKKHFIEGDDFATISLTKDEIRTKFQISKNAGKTLTLISETGYLMLVKSFTDDLAWKVQRELVNTYFKINKTQTFQPQISMEYINYLIEFEQFVKNKFDRMESLISILLPQPKYSAWKCDMASKIKTIAQLLDISSNDIKKIYGDIYNIMREDYDSNINPYTSKYLLEHPNITKVPVIDVVEYYSELKGLFETIVNNYLEIKSKKLN